MNAILLNMIANTTSFVLSLVISFFLTPYITTRVGVEAYGLIGLANSFIGYIQVFTMALNSMASRFIIIEIHKNKYDKANVYFSSVLYANTLIAIILCIPSIYLISNIHILNINPNLIFDAKLTFAIVAFSFAVNLIFSRYGLVLYVKNILWKGAFRTIESNLLRVGLVIAFLYYCDNSVFWIALATFISTLYPMVFNMLYSYRLLPELNANIKNFSLKAIWELISSGIWNSITKLGQILLDGLDLLLSNVFINGVMTGNVSIAKTIPMLYTSALAMISDSFTPRFLEFYAKGNIKGLLKEIQSSISILSMITGVCLSILIVYAQDFYSLWLPDLDSVLLRNITYCSVGTVLISGCIYSLYSVFSITNKLKANSLAILIAGVLSAVTTFLCLKFTNLGVYAIVGVSSLYGIIRNLAFTPVYAAKCLGKPFWTFYPVIFKNLMNIAVLIGAFSGIRYFIPIEDWSDLLVNGFIDVLVGVIITYTLVLNKDEKQKVLKFIKIKR